MKMREKINVPVFLVMISNVYLEQVRWLDCSTSPPRTDGPRCRRRNYQSRPGMIADMCYVTYGDREQLVTTFGRCEGLFCYNTTTDQMEWSVSGNYLFFRNSFPLADLWALPATPLETKLFLFHGLFWRFLI